MENSRGKLRRNDNQCQRGAIRANIERLVPAAGVEPATSRSGGERSNPLSYAGRCWGRKDTTAFVGLATGDARLPGRGGRFGIAELGRITVQAAQICRLGRWNH